MNEIVVASKINMENEELVILTDSGGWDICVTPSDTINLTKAKVVIIDHHDTLGDKVDININSNMSSTTEQVLDICMKLKGRRYQITKEISILGQIGIVSDTGRFMFENTRPETYELMGTLRREYEFDIQDFEYKNSKFPKESLIPIRIYIQNLKIEGDMAYTYITNNDIQSNGIEKVAINYAQMFVRENILRYMHGIHWGFVVKPSYANENEWQVSFRATMGYQKVDKIAEALNGGGHEYSSATRVLASDGTQAVQIVLDVVHKLLLHTV
jgi:phosphoesterase RecJ-like protein